MKTNNFIFIILSLLFVSISVYAQEKTMTGRILDTNGQPLIGVSILEKGTINGTLSDLNGAYSIKLTNAKTHTLVFSYLGYTTVEKVVSHENKIDVILQESIVDLNEVIVIGYGTAKKSDLTGAVNSLKQDDLSRVPSANVFEALQGVAPGILISKGSGAPGADVDIAIRGVNSLSAGTSPLIVLDGFPLAHGNISDINPNDIASIDILKDASATAIFGARGSNGVVLITTKNGRQSKGRINYSGYISVASPISKLDMMSGNEVFEFRREGLLGSGKLNPSVDEVLNYDPIMIDVYNQKKFVDWQDRFFKSSFSHDHDLSVNYNNSEISNVFGVNFHQEDGMLDNTSYRKISVRNNFNYQPLSWLKLGSSITLTNSVYDDVDNSLLESIFNLTPIAKVKDENGYLKYVNSDFSSSNQLINPYIIMDESKQQSKRFRFLGNFYSDFKIIEGLNFRLNFGIDKGNIESNYWCSSVMGDGNAMATVENGDQSSFNMDNILTYTKKFKNEHEITATLLHNIYINNSHTNYMSNKKFSHDLLDWEQIGKGTEPSLDRWSDEWKLQSFMARVQYIFKNRYLLTLTERYDGSSKFGKNNRWASFPSVAVAWKMNEESFLRDVDEISQLKLRLSYGVTGNQNIPTYNYVTYPLSNFYKLYGGSLFQYYSNPSGENSSNGPGNPSLKWEETKNMNIGVDFGFFNNRLNGSIEYYYSKTNDLLLNREIPRTNGAYKMYDNVGSVLNRGLEMSLNAIVISQKDFTWKVNINFTTNHNEITKLNVFDEDGNPVSDLTWGRIIGEPIGAVYDLKYLGTFKDQQDIDNHTTTVYKKDGTTEVKVIQPNAQPGDMKFADTNSDGTISDLDKTVLGSPNPKWYGSLGSSVTWKGFNFSFLLTTKQGMKKHNAWISDIDFSGRNSIPRLSYWTENNREGVLLPRPNRDNPNPRYISAVSVQDASFVFLQNVSLGYTLPRKICQKMRAESLRLHLTGNNLKYWTDFYGFSPESGNRNEYPLSKSFTFGVDVTF